MKRKVIFKSTNNIVIQHSNGEQIYPLMQITKNRNETLTMYELHLQRYEYQQMKNNNMTLFSDFSQSKKS